jgi:hypothetical protein
LPAALKDNLPADAHVATIVPPAVLRPSIDASFFADQQVRVAKDIVSGILGFVAPEQQASFDGAWLLTSSQTKLQGLTPVTQGEPIKLQLEQALAIAEQLTALAQLSGSPHARHAKLVLLGIKAGKLAYELVVREQEAQAAAA